MVGPERTRIWQACTTGKSSGHAPGTILAAGRQGIDIATGNQVLTLLVLQRPGKRCMSAAEYLNAVSLPKKLENSR
jgi:methionyl-tRNA formyltransferase